jgi:hypothetical protein
LDRNRETGTLSIEAMHDRNAPAATLAINGRPRLPQKGARTAIAVVGRPRLAARRPRAAIQRTATGAAGDSTFPRAEEGRLARDLAQD